MTGEYMSAPVNQTWNMPEYHLGQTCLPTRCFSRVLLETSTKPLVPIPKILHLYGVSCSKHASIRFLYLS
jgi:hypothetical protein